MVSIVVAIAVAAAGYAAAGWPGFRPHEIRVIGNVVVPSSEILARAEIDPRSNIWLQNTGAAARRIAEIPYVLKASVHRRLPAVVTIFVSERTPFANVRAAGGSGVVDETLRVLQTGALTGLPTIRLADDAALIPGTVLQETSTRAMRDVLAAMHDRGLNATEVEDVDGDVRARLAGGVIVLLGDQEQAKDSVALVQPILARFAALGRPVRILDLRSPQTPVATEGASPKVRVRRVRRLPTDP
jgi:cell division protein FtsQ